MKIIKKNWLLVLIIALALFVRLWGIDYGLPYFLVNDERPLVYGALKMGELKTLIPALHPEEFDIMNYRYNFLMSYVYLFFIVPFVLIYYLIGSFSSFSELTNYFILNPAPIWLLSRTINALIGTATIFLVYLTGKKMVNYRVGLLSSAFLAFSFLHIQLSHFTRPWIPMTFFTALTMFVSFNIYKSPERKHYIWMGIIQGLAYGINSGTVVINFIFLLAHFLSKKISFWQKIKDKNLWIFFIVFIIFAGIFISINPNSSSGLMLAVQSLFSGKSLIGLFQNFFFHLRGLLFYEPLISSFSLLGLIFLWIKSKRLFLISLSWPVFYIAFLYFINCVGCIEFPEELMQSRFLLVILPWLSILAGFSAYKLISGLKNNLKIIIIILLFSFPFAIGLQYDYLLNKGDNRAFGLDWVEKNIPKGAKIISNWASLNPTPTKEAILFQEKIDKNSTRITDKALLKLNDDNYPYPAYNILKIAYINKDNFIAPNDYQYYLLSFWREEDLSNVEKSLIDKGRLIQEFKQSRYEEAFDINGDFFHFISFLFFVERAGPTVRIYEL